MVLCVSVFALAPSRTEAGAFTLDDPTADLLAAGPDLTRISSNNDGVNVILTLDFAGAVSRASAGQANSVIGFIDLDVDNNPATGLPGDNPDLRIVQGGDTAPPGFAHLLGVDYFVDLNDVLMAGSSDVVITTTVNAFTPIGMGSLTQPSSTSLQVTIPLSVFSGGPVTVGPLVGIGAGVGALGSQLISDVAAVPEPSSIVLIGVGVLGLLSHRAHRRLRSA